MRLLHPESVTTGPGTLPHLAGSVLGRLHLRWWAPEPSGQVGQVEHAAGQPDDPEQLGLAVEMQEEVHVDDGADRRKDDIGHEPLRWAVLAPLADKHGDHAEVHGCERAEGAA